MRTRVTTLLVGLLAVPLLMVAVWPATNANAARGSAVITTCPNGSNWEKC